MALIWSGILGVDEGRIDAHTDGYQLGGDSLSLLTMLARICREILPPGQEGEFMSQLGRIITAPTLDNVSAITREVQEADGIWRLPRQTSAGPFNCGEFAVERARSDLQIDPWRSLGDLGPVHPPVDHREPPSTSPVSSSVRSKYS